MLQISDEFLKFLIFSVQLVHLQTCELTQTHIHDSPCLHLVEVETLHKVLNSLLRCLGGADYMYHLVDIVTCNNQCLKDMCTVLCLLQVELGAADSHVMAVVNEVLHTFLK